MSGGGGGDFSEKTMNSVINDLNLIMTTLNENGALIFASVNPEEIHDLKHKVVTKFESGGSAYGWEGASDHDFLDFLPGVSWFTFFGAEYVQCIGANKLQNLDDVEYIQVGIGAIVLKHKKNISEISLLDLERLEDQIGNHHQDFPLRSHISGSEAGPDCRDNSCHCAECRKFCQKTSSISAYKDCGHR